MQNRAPYVYTIATLTFVKSRITIMEHMLYQRWQYTLIQEALETRRVLLLAGARQCGKTTLAKTLITDDVLYRTLDNAAFRQLAQQDPHGFVRNDHKMLIIDEVQRAPDLLPAVKMQVDEDTRPGQYLLTGSSNIQSLPAVKESLAGRIRKIRLRTLSQGERLGCEPDFLGRAFTESFGTSSHPYDREALMGMALQGGFPEVLSLHVRSRKQWHRDYVAALIERDLRDITHIQRQDAMQELLVILAAWSSKFMDIAAIGSGLSIRRPTLESYINALESLYVVERVKPWTHTDYARVGKQSKLFMTDSGLMASLLGWNEKQIQWDGDRSGKLIETFMFNEIAALVDASGGTYNLFHYRDREKREIDFLVEREDGALLGIEIKAGSSIGSNDFKHLRWFRDNIANDRPFTGIVLYAGELSGKMGQNLWAIPFGELWRC